MIWILVVVVWFVLGYCGNRFWLHFWRGGKEGFAVTSNDTKRLPLFLLTGPVLLIVFVLLSVVIKIFKLD